jgi:TctA family transporter
MMRYIIVILITIIFLLIQNSLSKKRKVFFIFILPILNILIGIIYQVSVISKLQLRLMVPFFMLSLSLLVFGFNQRSENQRKEMDKMKSQDL